MIFWFVGTLHGLLYENLIENILYELFLSIKNTSVGKNPFLSFKYWRYAKKFPKDQKFVSNHFLRWYELFYHILKTGVNPHKFLHNFKEFSYNNNYSGFLLRLLRYAKILHRIVKSDSKQNFHPSELFCHISCF